MVLGGFQLWLWGTRIVNLLGEVGSFSAAFVAVHLVLYIAAIGAGVWLLALGWRLLREVTRAVPGGPEVASSHETPRGPDVVGGPDAREVSTHQDVGS